MNLHELTEEARSLKEAFEKYDTAVAHKPWKIEEIYTALVSDVGDLGRLVLAKEGFKEVSDLEKNLSHELGEILWATLLIAETYGVNLEHAFLEEMKNRKASLV